MGRSEVQGWGLFAGQDIEKDEFIGEYRGEVISRDESDRRGAVYHYRGLEYLFGVSESKFFVLSILPHLR
jgi:histone-lysine N-methyltransferase EZH2